MNTELKKNPLARAVALSLLLMSANLHAATTVPLSIAQTPLYLAGSVAPNIVVTLDDSGSMTSGFVPDALSSYASTKRYKAASFNPLYYDPTATYTPPPKYDGTFYPNSSYSAAWLNGFDSTRGTVNLTNNYYATSSYNPSSTSQSNATTSGVSAKGYYYTYDPTATACTSPATTNDNCYLLHYVASGEQQNFANWFSYYRTRNLSVASGAMAAFSGLNSNVRVAWQSLTTCTTFGTTCAGWDGVKVDNRIRTFYNNSTTSQKANFYKWASRLPAGNNTPLRTAMQKAGEYYKTTGVGSPYAYEPQVTDSPEYSCRKDFHVMMTDGIWNDSYTLSSPANADSTSTPLPATVLATSTDAGVSTYTPQAPFNDGNSSSLADVAFRYWVTDLAPTLPNNVSQYMPDNSGTSLVKFYDAKNDPATWQHMVNFTVGLGLNDTLVSTSSNAGWYGNTYASNSGNTDGYAALVKGTKTWPATSANLSPGNVYDLWHAALDSRGQFFSVSTPASISAAFTSIVNSILASASSASSAAANSSQLNTNTLVFQAQFNATNWSGALLAYQVNPDGSVGSVAWDASTLLPTASSRNLYTINSSTKAGLAFTSANFSALSTTQQANLNTSLAGTTDTNGPDRVNWLRGDQSKEQKNGGTFRNRTVILGDMINSDPAFMQDTDFGYANIPSAEGSSYTAFYQSNLSRLPMVYVGANDGFLHGFRADAGNISSGQELLGYAPAAVYANLSKLTDPAYAHGYYVDGTATVGDAYVNGAWKTVLLGSLGGGGKSIFALDVTDPTNFNATKVIGEYTDPDLGYTYSAAKIARLHDGSWAAIFGNGYNSTTGNAYLFIVNLSTGAIKKIATDAAVSNGLSTPALVDTDGDHVTDYVYAGDLQGRVWKFDLTSTSSSAWGLSYSGQPLFTARNGNGQVQPITGQVNYQPNSATSSGNLVYFGTGRYVASGDPSIMDTETLYGIWDNNAPITTTDRSQLQVQTLLAEVTVGANTARATSANTVNWATQKGWYMDLLQPPSSTQQGERVVSVPLLRPTGTVVFTTLIPSTDPCVTGGTSWVVEVNAQTGARMDSSVFDLNGDQKFDTSDYATVIIGGVPTLVAVSGLKSTVGIIKTPAVVDTGTGKEYKFLSGSSGSIQSLTEKAPCVGNGCGTSPLPPPPPATGSRTSWKELL